MKYTEINFYIWWTIKNEPGTLLGRLFGKIFGPVNCQLYFRGEHFFFKSIIQGDPKKLLD